MGGRQGRQKRSKNKKKVTIADSFNPQGENVNIRDVYIGTTHDSGSQPGTSKFINEKGQEKPLCSREIEIEEMIKSNLTRRFEKIKLPKLSWLETSNISIEKYAELELRWKGDSKCNENIKLQNVFDVSKGEKLRRIFIESEPGFGKTTLTHKIVSDWVKKEKYVSRFKFTILVILKWVGSKSMKEYLVEMIGVDESDAGADYVWKLINTEETLLILDGLDEISEEARQNIQEVLFDPKNKYLMTTLATSRVGLHGCRESNLDALFRGVETGRDFWDKKITILGIIGESRRRAFFQNFLEDDESELQARLCDITLSREEQFKSPLLLILLVYILRGNEVTKIVTNTDLYKNLVDCVIKRNISKNNPNVTLKNFSIFDGSYKLVMQSSRGRESFYKFGEMSVDHILSDNLQFDDSEITSAVYELGFLSKQENSDSFDTNYFYEGFHLTLVEFAVSFYFLEEYRKSEKQFTLAILEKINEICVKKTSLSMVIPFLCGLLEKDVAILFDRFSRYRVLYCTNELLIENILRECVMDDYIGEYFARLSPSYFTVSSSFSKSSLSNQYLRKNLKCLNIGSPYLWDIQFPIVVDTLIILLKNQPITQAENCIQIANNIQCKTAIFFILEATSYSVMEQNLKLLVELNSEFKYLQILDDDTNYTAVKKCIDNGATHGLKLDYFEIWLSVERDMNIVAWILENIDVKRLYLYFLGMSPTTAATSLVSVATSLNYTTSVTIKAAIFNENFRLDFAEITKNEEKEWEMLRIDNVIVECQYPLKHKPNIKSISTNSTRILSTVEHEINALLSVTPTRLHCNYHLLELLNGDERAKTWGGWDSVVELMLTISDPNFPSESSFSDFSRFVNVRTVHLEIISRSEEADLTNIIRCLLKSANVNHLEIKWYNECYMDEFILKIHDTISLLESVVIEIVFDPFFEKLKDIRFNFERLKAILKCNSKINCHLIFLLDGNLNVFVRQNFLELGNFNVEYQLEYNDLKTQISNWSNTIQYTVTDYHVLILELRNSDDTQNFLKC